VLLEKLGPIGHASYDPDRACLAGTRETIIDDIKDWSRIRGGLEKLLWVHGHAGLGKSAIVASVCN
jgi:hypothetical protein